MYSLMKHICILLFWIIIAKLNYSLQKQNQMKRFECKWNNQVKYADILIEETLFNHENSGLNIKKSV